MLEITEVVISYPENNTYKPLKAYAGVVLNDVLQLNYLKIISGHKGLFVSYPGAKEQRDYCQAFYPLTNQLRGRIEAAVLAEYRRVIQ
jgi:DNA-binding cell septation regulator SpoVG